MKFISIFASRKGNHQAQKLSHRSKNLCDSTAPRETCPSAKRITRRDAKTQSQNTKPKTIPSFRKSLRLCGSARDLSVNQTDRSQRRKDAESKHQTKNDPIIPKISATLRLRERLVRQPNGSLAELAMTLTGTSTIAI